MRALFRYLLALAALLAIWQIGSLALGEFLLPRPLDVLAYFGEALTTGAFWQHAGASAWRVLSAMSLAWLVAFPLGLILGHVRSVDNTLSPMVFLTYPLPKIVLLPLFLTLFGLGDLPRVLLIALTTGYQILVVTRASAQGLDKKYLDSFRSLGGTLLVNVSGSLLMGLLAGCWQRWGTPSAFALFAGAGFLGALTTFSTFSMDTLAAFHAGHPAKAMLNIGLNTTLCLTATAAAYFLIVP